MSQIFKIKAEISINDKAGKDWYIISGYRTKFIFGDHHQIVGHVDLLDKEKLKAGESCMVEVSFETDIQLSDIHVGTEFGFYEFTVEIGRGKVLDLMGWVN